MDVRLDSVTKRYSPAVTAVDRVSVNFPSGKVTAIVGPSGSGKSSLLNLVAGLLQPTEGRVFFGEKDVTDVPPEKRNIGYVFQSYALFPHLNVEQNIVFGLNGRSAAESQTVRERLISLFQLSALRLRKPKELSGGERQRVALARAIAREPQVLLLDEPLSALDAQLRDFLREELGRFMHSFGRTTLYVTHDRQEAMLIADQLVVMKEGRIVQSGRPGEIYRHPVDTFVATFFGDANLIPGRIRNGSVESSVGTFRVADESAIKDEGAEALLLLRPEMFTPTGSRGEIQLRVDRPVFLGSRWRVYGQDQHRNALVVDLPGDHPVAAGEILELNIRRDAVHVIGQKAQERNEAVSQSGHRVS